MALVTYSLTTLANLKEHLGITVGTDDSLLTNIINRSTDIIEAYCDGRRFAETTYTNEEYSGTGTQLINLRNYPVTSLTAYDWNTGTAGSTDWNSLQSEFIKAIDDGQGPGQVYYETGFVEGMKNYRFSYVAGYATIPNDLEEACLEMCSWIFNDRKSKGLQSETLGEYSYTKVVKKSNAIEDLGLDLILDKYLTPVV